MDRTLHLPWAPTLRIAAGPRLAVALVLASSCLAAALLPASACTVPPATRSGQEIVLEMREGNATLLRVGTGIDTGQHYAVRCVSPSYATGGGPLNAYFDGRLLLWAGRAYDVEAERVIEGIPGHAQVRGAEVRWLEGRDLVQLALEGPAARRTAFPAAAGDPVLLRDIVHFAATDGGVRRHSAYRVPDAAWLVRDHVPGATGVDAQFLGASPAWVAWQVGRNASVEAVRVADGQAFDPPVRAGGAVEAESLQGDMLYLRRAVPGSAPTTTGNPYSPGTPTYERWSIHLPDGVEGPAYVPPTPDLKGRSVVETSAPEGSVPQVPWPVFLADGSQAPTASTTSPTSLPASPHASQPAQGAGWAPLPTSPQGRASPAPAVAVAVVALALCLMATRRLLGKAP